MIKEVIPEKPPSFLESMDDWSVHSTGAAVPHPDSRENTSQICTIKKRFMIDSGACDTVVTMDSLSVPLDRSQAKEYYVVNDSPIVIEGRQDATIAVDTANGPACMAVSAAATQHTSEDIMAVCKTMDAGFDVLFSSKGCVVLPSDLQLLEAATESSEGIPFYPSVIVKPRHVV